MLGDLDKSTFRPNENYNDFYAGHKFEPLDEKTALNVDQILPRGSWAMDVAREIDARTALDVCCLDGFISLTLAYKLGIQVTGIDLSKPGIALAKERAVNHKLPANYECVAAEDFNPGITYDLIILFEAIEHFTDVDKVMAMIKTNLKPGGTLLVSTPDAEGRYGIENVEDICHLQIYTHRKTGELPTMTHQGKPIISLADYLGRQGFDIVENEVWNELVCVRAQLPKLTN